MAITGIIKPGDVLVTKSGGTFGWLIRLGAALRDHPNLSNHVAVVHHADPNGTLWAIEGRPGGAGWRDCRDYLRSDWTIANTGQPKTDIQRAAICQTMQAMIGSAYDFEAIAADAGQAFGLGSAWLPDFKTGQVPGAVVCSSLAAYAYSKNGLSHPPGPDRTIDPSGWDTFILTEGWHQGNRGEHDSSNGMGGQAS